jgi:hypothetical protein
MSIANEGAFLTDLAGRKVALAPCVGKSIQRWDYMYSENLQSRSSYNCLTEEANEVFKTADCILEDITRGIWASEWG